MPAGSSRCAVSRSQPLSPKERRTAGSAMPSPSSLTVTRMAAEVWSWLRTSVTTATRVAPLRREFWMSSVNAWASPASKKRVTRSMAPSWTRARIVAATLVPGTLVPGRWVGSVMAVVSHESGGRKGAPPNGPEGRRPEGRRAEDRRPAGRREGTRSLRAAQEGGDLESVAGAHAGGIAAVARNRRRGRDVSGGRIAVAVVPVLEADGVDDHPGSAARDGHGVHGVDRVVAGGGDGFPVRGAVGRFGRRSLFHIARIGRPAVGSFGVGGRLGLLGRGLLLCGGLRFVRRRRLRLAGLAVVDVA